MTDNATPEERYAEIQVVPDTGPQMLIGGTFAIYADGAGGLVLVTDVEGRGTERRAVPAALVKMLSGNGPFARMAARMFNSAED